MTFPRIFTRHHEQPEDEQPQRTYVYHNDSWWLVLDTHNDLLLMQAAIKTSWGIVLGRVKVCLAANVTFEDEMAARQYANVGAAEFSFIAA